MVHQALEVALISMADGCLQCLANSDCQCICDPCMDKMCPPKKASEGNEEEAESTAPEDSQHQREDEPLITQQPGYNTFMVAKRQSDGDEE